MTPAHLRLLLPVLAALWPAPVAAAPPTADLHEFAWFVHVDLIEAGAGRDLAYYQDLIDAALAGANERLVGGHGPFDTPCCTELSRSVALTTFGTSGDGLDVIDMESEYATIGGIGLPGSRGFLVDGITTCGVPAPTAIGCAVRPTCSGNPNDDPDLWLVVTLDAADLDVLANTVAHERGHNACLPHVDAAECQLMRAAIGGDCLDAGECANYRDGRTTTGGSCECLAMGGGAEPDGTSCSEFTDGLCSGGLCGDPEGDAGIQLLGAGGPESGSGAATDDLLLHSGLTGGWSAIGAFGAGAEPKGLAYATDRDTLYGVVPGPGDDTLVTIDVASGAVTGTVLTRSNGSDELVALAYDPGATSASGDDRLLALESDGTFEDLVELDLSTPVPGVTVLGPLAGGAPDGFRGLAYDSANDVLYVSSPFVGGLYTIGETCTPLCPVSQVPGLDLPRIDASLAYSPATQQLHLVGTRSGLLPLGNRTLYDVIDATTLVAPESLGIDAHTPGGLAVTVPEPAAWLQGAFALALLALLARRRDRRPAHGPGRAGTAASRSRRHAPDHASVRASVRASIESAPRSGT